MVTFHLSYYSVDSAQGRLILHEISLELSAELESFYTPTADDSFFFEKLFTAKYNLDIHPSCAKGKSDGQ